MDERKLRYADVVRPGIGTWNYAITELPKAPITINCSLWLSWGGSPNRIREEKKRRVLVLGWIMVGALSRARTYGSWMVDEGWNDRHVKVWENDV